MDYENIIAGLTPGGSNKVYEARILICFLFNLLNKPMSKTDINNILQYQGLINYFTFAQAFNDLIDDSQVQICENLLYINKNNNNEVKYILTPKGKETVDVFKDTIAVTVKERLLNSAEEYLKNLKLEQDNVVKIRKVDDGYMVSCRVKDIGSDLINLEIFSPDKDTAEKIKKNFILKSLELYQTIFEFLTWKLLEVEFLTGG